MKVAFDVAQTCGQRAGCPWFADSLARGIAALGERDLELELLHHFGGWPNVSTESGTRIPGIASLLANLNETEAISFWKHVAAQGLPGSPEIVHSNCFNAPVIPGSKLIFTAYDLSFWLYPEFAHSATHVVCQRGILDALDRAAGIAFISEAGRNDFERLFPDWIKNNAVPTTVLYGASRFDTAPRRETADDAPWLCVGSIEPRKNHSALIDAYLAYRDLVSNPRRLVIAGGQGWSNEGIHDRIRNAANEGIEYLGYVPDEELPELYSGAFALVQPSWHEGFGLPVIEAMGFGTPVICSDIPTLREVAGDAAVFFPPGDPAMLAKAMARLDDDPNLAKQLSDKSAERSADFSWEKTARQAVAFYREILQLT